MSYDPKCEELAEYFLDDDDQTVSKTTLPHDEAVKSLAQAIQDAIENWFPAG